MLHSSSTVPTTPSALVSSEALTATNWHLFEDNIYMSHTDNHVGEAFNTPQLDEVMGLYNTVICKTVWSSLRIFAEVTDKMSRAIFNLPTFFYDNHPVHVDHGIVCAIDDEVCQKFMADFQKDFMLSSYGTMVLHSCSWDARLLRLAEGHRDHQPGKINKGCS